MLKTRVSRRKALKLGVAAAALPLVHIRTAGAAGKLSIGFWDHWVPAGNDVMRKQVAAFAEKNKVEVQADFITSVGNKNLLTLAAEAQAKTGHDVQAFPSWEVLNHVNDLEPMDDVMGRLGEKYGAVNRVVEYLAKIKGHWLAVPSSSGTQNKGPCGRISILKDAAGLDVQAMYPARPEHTALADAWTYDAMLKAAEACAKIGKQFGMGLGQTSDSVDAIGSIFAAFGAELVNAKGEITVKSDAVRQVLEYGQRLVKFLPADAVSYDDASNNRALISGQSALIWNPPSAWAVAKRDALQVASDCWTFPPPTGPKGRFVPYLPYFWGMWKFSQNKTAGKELIEFLMQRDNVEARCTVVEGYDLPPFDGMLDFKVWEEVQPPKGTVYNYPLRKHHNSMAHIAALPAPPDVAVQIYNRGTMPTMFAKLQSGQSIPQVVAWAADELEGFTR
ncbi:ABC transporter substrate-binding protein [Limobrevibacterium gyesilva]|uniref:Extracellular solute-binding protein n=1 Tax=Limobrevibacterium gyesilva TaxID=2991712 RepID=A0AA41YKV8_9PROT|nr:extracellular solute-binding protein [Limobrevibacterium gyesilva]MCW3474251.1 extracellular solute-binding protein [Limobrevibacterium gyesilva]